MLLRKHLFLITLIAVLVVYSIGAYFISFPQPVVVSPTFSDDYQGVDDLATQQLYLGELMGYPHMFELIITGSTTVSVAIGQPRGRDPYPLSGLLVKQERRGVSEVSRFNAAEASLATTRWRISGDQYQETAPVTAELLPGRYYFEVSNANNIGKYMLFVNTEEPFPRRGPLSLLGDMATLKSFFGKSLFSVLLAPVCLLPLVLLAGVWWYSRRQNV